MLSDPDDSTRHHVHVALVAAGLVGTCHAAFSLYWSAGGSWLAWSLGSRMLETFAGHEWMLAPVGIVKLLAALGPIALARRAWPGGRLTRSTCWLGAAALIAWGGANTVVANLVLAGVIRPSGGYDHAGMVGHGYLWDPLFLAWGIALTIGLATRSGNSRQGASSRSTVSTSRSRSAAA